jgi:microcin C transport system substrate-binding protein
MERMKTRLCCLGLLATLVSSACAEEVFPKEGWEDRPNPIASPDAYVGGEISIYGHQYPKSFNYYLDLNVFSSQLFGSMFDTLMSIHPITLDLEPQMARRLTVSDDRKTFTIDMDPAAMWSDGKPVTASDVQWTYDMIMNPENLTGPHKIDMERFERPEVVSDLKIRFTAKTEHWNNLLAIAMFRVLPRHVYEGRDFNKVNFEFPVVSGLYRLGDVKEGVYAKLERRDDYWNANAKRNAGTGNFKTLRFVFFMDQDNAFESFKKGAMDLFPVYSAQQWVMRATGPEYDQGWIVKQKVYNSEPIGFQGFAMNMRRFPFDDVRVRKALAHLLDRERLNKTIMYDQYFLHRSYWEDLYDSEHPCENELIDFNPDKARALLKEAGWVADPETGLLEKDGRPFSFKFLTRDASSDKFLVIYQEELKNVGIEFKIEQKDWAAWLKDMDAFNFDMTWAAWGSSLWKDPESLWYSKEADRPSGQNVTGFKHADVDALIEKQKVIFDVQERNAILREIDRIITAEVPYVLLWNLNYTRLLYWNKFGTPETVLDKYGSESAAYGYWWYDEDAAADLADARANNRPLPRKPAVVKFDEVVR